MKLREMLDNPFLASWYPQAKRQVEIAQELFGLDEDAWVDLQIRVVRGIGEVTPEDVERFEQIRQKSHE